MSHRTRFVALVTVALLMSACAQPAATSPTAAPSKPAPAEAAKPVAPTAAAKFDPKAIEEFYRGKTVKIVVGLAAGGGFDTYARLIARHLPKYLPGSPTVIVENQVGAGSLIAANSVYKTGAKDGTVLVHFQGGLIAQKYVVENAAVEFDPTGFNYIGAPTSDEPVCAIKKDSGFTSLEQARTKELIVGAVAPGSPTYDVPSILKAGLGLKIKMVDGYDGTAKIRLAADQGEVMGGCWGYESIQSTWKDALDKQDVVILAQSGPEPRAELKDIPLFRSLAQNDEERQLIEAGIVAPALITRAFAMPPGVPTERVEAVRQAFAETLKDPALLDEAKKASLEIKLIPPDEFNRRIKELQELSPTVKQKLKSALEGKA
jgi:tripartite-type tricarboxylate transporter receptor subunit TctC